MSVIFHTRKLCLFRKPFKSTLSKYISLRKNSDVPRKFKTFDEIVTQRRAEAKRSLVVQVNSESSFDELYGYCSKYATIKDIYHYKNSGEEHYMIIEFSSEENIKEIIKSCSSYSKDHDVMPVPSPFLWFKAVSGNKGDFKTEGKTLAIKDGTDKIDDDYLIEQLSQCETVSDQIQLLYDRTILNDLGVRLRYLVARQLEVIFNSLYSNVRVQPFGSSVNGFGKMGCDLDLVLTNRMSEETEGARLVFQHGGGGGGRGAAQRHAELAGAVLALRVAGAARVLRVLHARVPIVKYRHRLAALDVDLACLNESGVYMSELLVLLSSLDARVAPLAVLVRRWAAAAGLTQPHPGRWLTNFPLTVLVLFFLQQPGVQILPSVKYLVDRAEKSDIRLAEENLNCTFLRDMNKLPAGSYGQSQDDLQTLLLKFFEFYAQFDFQDKAISINEGRAIRKPNSLPLYIVNPLEQSLNVSRNVSFEECERFRLEVRNAAWHLEACLEGKKGEDWGILSLIEKKASRGLKKLIRVGNSHRLVSVKDLFIDNDDDPPVEGIRSKLQKLVKTEKEIETSVKDMKREINREKKTEKVKFKNSQTASEVYRIRRDKIV